MEFGRFKTKEDALVWANYILSLRVAFCSEIIEKEVELAIEILLTYLPDPQIGIVYKGDIYLKDKYKPLCCSPEKALDIIQNQ
jgi:hypothetical protein